MSVTGTTDKAQKELAAKEEYIKQDAKYLLERKRLQDRLLASHRRDPTEVTAFFGRFALPTFAVRRKLNKFLQDARMA